MYHRGRVFEQINKIVPADVRTHTLTIPPHARMFLEPGMGAGLGLPLADGADTGLPLADGVDTGLPLADGADTGLPLADGADTGLPLAKRRGGFVLGGGDVVGGVAGLSLDGLREGLPAVVEDLIRAGQQRAARARYTVHTQRP
eukprot:753294-Prorocentrum_minimum.AAC.1